MLKGMCLILCECVIGNDSYIAQNLNQINSSVGTALFLWLGSFATSGFKELALKCYCSSLRDVIGKCSMQLVSLQITLLSLIGNDKIILPGLFLINFCSWMLDFTKVLNKTQCFLLLLHLNDLGPLQLLASKSWW